MDLSGISDETLLGKVDALAETERFSLVDLLLHLGELDRRGACQERGYASVFAYLTRHLGYSESDAVRRVRAARAAREYPSILRMLANGDLHLVSIAMLEPWLTSENHEGLLRKASRRSTREVERLVAELAPAAPEPRDRVRSLPPPAPPPPTPPIAVPALLDIPSALDLRLPATPFHEPPASPQERRVVFTFTAREEVQSWFAEARDLLRHRFPAGRMEEIFGEALRRLVEAEHPTQSGRLRTTKPAPACARGRSIPKWVQDEVWRRDCGRCAFIGPDGVRCGDTAWLEYDHIIPWALGGISDDPDNVRLLCREHNQHCARKLFGEDAVG
ncbi:MAG: hypothetical protein A2X36_17030 [Elusimicrobia bacterium GWA2_69_24]|nr:MAG: hypothetical protein A2X36_17030 [Elusimicrobia bacterium GWA2_69_24]